VRELCTLCSSVGPTSPEICPGLLQRHAPCRPYPILEEKCQTLRMLEVAGGGGPSTKSSGAAMRARIRRAHGVKDMRSR
jgi:hypothetical protein